MGYCHDFDVTRQELSRTCRVCPALAPIDTANNAHRSARIFLGLAEGGLFPGVTFYLSLWYKRAEQSRRVAIFFSAATVAGAFGGILAFAIEKLEGKGGLHGWAWIVSLVRLAVLDCLTSAQFLIEGLLTIVVAFASYFYMYDVSISSNFCSGRC
jgi:MFS family permease